MTSPASSTTCGFVCLLGVPNVGKSTLVNTLVGEKIAAVTHKRQTTRMPIRGIFNMDLAQMILVDTPGIFAPKKQLETAMVRAAWRSARTSDVILLILDARRPVNADEQRILRRLQEPRWLSKPIFIALNKIDLINEALLLQRIDELQAESLGRGLPHIFPVSAQNGKGVARLKEHLAAQLPPSVWLYPDGEQMGTDQSLALRAAEVTRENVFRLIHDEIPYQLMVETSEVKKAKGGLSIYQTILVTRVGQKRIVVGEKGETIKAIRLRSQEQLAKMLNQRIHLFLLVKVDANWDKKLEHYEAIGL